MSGVNLRPTQRSPFPPQKQASSPLDGNITSSEHAQLSSLLSRMTERAIKQRLHIKPHFQDYDKHNQGNVSLAQFSRVIALFGFDVSTDIMNLMAKQYAVNGDTTKISYKRFLADLTDDSSLTSTIAPSEYKTTTLSSTQQQQQQPLIRRTDITIPRTTIIPINVESILHRIQTYVSDKRIILNDIFQDFDTLRRKRIPLSRFRSCLNSLGVHLKDDELDALLPRFEYQDDVGQVNYPAFIAAVNSAFHLYDPERNPSATMSHWSPFTPQDATTTHFTDEERARLQSLISAIGHAAYTRRILVKPAFQHHDRHHNGCVTRTQFESVISTSFPINLSSSDLHLLADLYTRGDIGVNYSAFVQDVNATEKEIYEAAITGNGWATEGQQPLNKTLQPATTHHTPDLDSLLTSLLSQLASQRRLLGNDTFKDFDRLNKGRLTSEQFHRTLNVSGLKFTPQQFLLLQHAYASQGDIKHIDYTRFIQDCSTVPSISTRPHA